MNLIIAREALRATRINMKTCSPCESQTSMAVRPRLAVAFQLILATRFLQFRKISSIVILSEPSFNGPDTALIFVNSNFAIAPGAPVPLSRILYIIASLGWVILLWPNPITIFLAACLSCLTLPIYRKLRIKAARWRKSGPSQNTRRGRLLLKLSYCFPVTVYTFFIIFCAISPIGLLIGLVSPQAVAGYAKFRELWEANLRLPPHLLEYWHSFRKLLAEYPTLEKTFNDALDNMNSVFSDAIGMLVSRSFGFVGTTMNLVWISFLFLTITIIFTIHWRLIRKVTCRMLHIPSPLLSRFLTAIYKALKAITLGIVLVAVVQGTLCGIGFAVAGINQPAFWGMLATIVAPIPVVGTALVWAPLCISLWFTGNPTAAICLALWGALFISGVDNVLRPFFLRQGIKAPFFVLILTILCGLNVFGAVGLVAGPVLLAVSMQAYDEANTYHRAAN